MNPPVELPRRPTARTVPVTALLPGGTPDAIALQLRDLRAQVAPLREIWVLQAPHDRAVAALARDAGPPVVRVIATDRPLGPWAPLVFAWFLPTSYALLLSPKARLGPYFVALAMQAMHRHRAAISPAGVRQGAAFAGTGADSPVDAGSGAWLVETSWIRHAWREPPAVLEGDPWPLFEGALRRSGIPAMVAALPAGASSHLPG